MTGGSQANENEDSIGDPLRRTSCNRRGVRGSATAAPDGLFNVARSIPFGVSDQRGFWQLTLVESPSECETSFTPTQPLWERRENDGASCVIHGRRNSHPFGRRHAPVALVHHCLKGGRSIIHGASLPGAARTSFNATACLRLRSSSPRTPATPKQFSDAPQRAVNR